MNKLQVETWFKQWATVVNDEMEYISDLDNAIGDGDHGFNMSKGLSAYLEAKGAKETNTIQDELKLLGMTLLSKVGGASGPLYGSAFLAMAKVMVEDKDYTLLELADALQAGIDSIMLRGKAQRLEKTMVDVWLPVIESLKNGTLTATMVDAYVEATKPLKATKGRAAYLGDRSIGHIDPGSYSSGLLFKSLLENS